MVILNLLFNWVYKYEVIKGEVVYFDFYVWDIGYSGF